MIADRYAHNPDQQTGPHHDDEGSAEETVTIFSFLYYFARPLTRSCITLTSHHPFVDALHLNAASFALRRAWLISILRFHGRPLLHVQRVAQLASFLSHRPLTFYIRLSFSAMDTAWSVRWVSTYIRWHLLYLYL